MKTRRISLKYIFFLTSIYLFIFQNLIQKYIPIFKYFDEVFALLFFPILIFNGRKTLKIKIHNIGISLYIFFVILIGVISSVAYSYQSLKAVLSDALVFFKFFMIYYISSKLWDLEMIVKYKKNLVFNIRLIVIMLMMMTVLAYTTNLFPSDYRFGMFANKLFYSHQTYLVAVCVFLYALYIIANGKLLDIYICFLALIVISTLRVKAFGALMVSTIISIYVWQRKRKIQINKVLVLGVALVLIFSNAISYYFFSANLQMARTQLLINSFKVANDYFPLGAGFATFGSYFSGVYYSPLYSKYMLSNIWGLTRDFYSFVADSFWPMLIAQFGYIGVFFYLMILYEVFKKIQSTFDIENIFVYIGKLVCFAYLVVSSIAENSFAGPIGLSLAIIIGLSTKLESDAQ